MESLANDNRVNLSMPNSELSDEQLLLRYQSSREQGLFAELVRRYERELFSYLCRYLGSAEMAEDAFQATFLQLHLKCEQFDTEKRLRPWLYMIATNKAIDSKRQANRHRSLSLDSKTHDDGEGGTNLLDILAGQDLSPAGEVDQREQGSWIVRAMHELPDNLRSVVNLVYFQGLKYREAAEVLNIPVGTVKSRVNTAISKLTEAWETTFSTLE